MNCGHQTHTLASVHVLMVFGASRVPTQRDREACRSGGQTS